MDTDPILLYSVSNNFRKEFFMRLILSWVIVMITILLSAFIFPATWPLSTTILLQDVIVLLIAILINHFVIKERIGLDFKSGLSNAIVLNIPTWFILTSAVTLALDPRYQKNLVLALSVAISAAVFEEYFFRGMLLPYAIRHFNNQHAILIGVIVSSVLFGFSHMLNLGEQPLEPTLIQGASAFLIGLFMAAIYLRTHNLIWPILFHFTNDFGSVISSGTAVYTSYLNPVRLLGTLILFGGLSAFYLRKDRQKQIKERFNF